MAEDMLLEHVASLLARENVFPPLDRDHLRAVAPACSWFSVPGGMPLLRQGDPSDAIYVVASGILGAYRHEAGGGETFLGRIGAGEIVGEMGFITGEPRSATIRALRSSELLKISGQDLEALAGRFPAVLFALCKTLVRRLRNAQERPVLRFKPRTFCVLPYDGAVDAGAFARQFATALGGTTTALVLTEAQAETETADWFHQLEKVYDHLVYQAEPAASAWTRLCLRQADCILLLARGPARPGPFTALGASHEGLPPGIPAELVLLWDRRIEPSRTADWLDAARPRAHHHVRSAADAARAARLLTGRGLGLVLSGGGARGLAHLGVVRALREHGIGVDAVGGTSVGAVVGAALALEWDHDFMERHYIEAFVNSSPLSDVTVPRFALLSGRKLERSLTAWFGDTGIEELPIRYFCVSTDLSNGVPSVHSRGRLARWLRASTAIPGVFPPVLDEGVVHVDGGVLDNLPVAVMKASGVDRIIAVDVASGAALASPRDSDVRPGSANAGEPSRPPNIVELLWRVGTIGSDAKAASIRRQCDVLLRPAVEGVGLLGWQAYAQAMEAGYRVAVERLSEIEAVAASRLSPPPRLPVRPP